jgi:hypothetical protein
MKKKQWLKTALIAVAFGLTALSRPVLAKDDACADDKTKFCSDVDATDRKAMGTCLKTHKADLSDGCKAQMAKHHKKPSSDQTTPPAASTTPPGTGSPGGN